MIPRLLQSTTTDTPPETIFLLGIHRDSGQHVLFLPVVDTAYSFSLESHGKLLQINGHCVQNTPTVLENPHEIAALVAMGDDPFQLIADSMNIVKTHIRALNPYFIQAEYQRKGVPSVFPRGPGPSFVDRLGWCTWNAYYTNVNADNIIHGLSTFQSRGITPGFIILDDGWQHTDIEAEDGGQWTGMLKSFGTKPSFGGTIGYDLKQLIQFVKANFNIDAFLLWHTLTGYWRGVEITSQVRGDLDKFLSTIVPPKISQAELRMSPNVREYQYTHVAVGRGVGLIPPEHIHQFFAEYHACLAAAGVDGVKVDAQAMLPSLSSELLGGGIHLTSSYHFALQQSISNSFGTSSKSIDISVETYSKSTPPVDVEFPVIHCMCHSQGTLLCIASMYPDLEEDRSTHCLRPLIRGSDDFWPTRAASMGPHIYTNAMNSLLISEIGLHDWDMFMTSMGAPSRMHGVARAISGGPVYTSDLPNKQNQDIYQHLAFKDGAIPRCIRNAHPVARMLFEDPQRCSGVPLLLQNANADGYVIGAFNIAGSVVENDVNGFRALKYTEMTLASLPKAFRGSIDDIRPVWEIPELLESLKIDCNVYLSDIQELAATKRRATQHTADTFIAHRSSDSKLFGPIDSTHDPPIDIKLAAVYDCEVITFSNVHTFASTESRASYWIAAIGAVDMYNPGGAVLGVDTSLADTDPCTITIDVIGFDCTYQIISNFQPQNIWAKELLDDASTQEESLSPKISSKVIWIDSLRHDAFEHTMIKARVVSTFITIHRSFDHVEQCAKGLHRSRIYVNVI